VKKISNRTSAKKPMKVFDIMKACQHHESGSLPIAPIEDAATAGVVKF